MEEIMLPKLQRLSETQGHCNCKCKEKEDDQQPESEKQKKLRFQDVEDNFVNPNLYTPIPKKF